jgi:hypothetical protein
VCHQSSAHDRFSIQRLTNGTWVNSSDQEFVDSLTPETIVCVFIDGNRIDPSSAIARGLSLSRRLRSPYRLRLVIWSWPSDRIFGPLRDARVKTNRSDLETYYLGSWLSRLPAKQRVSLVGYSLGGRIATGALHLLGGGVLFGNSLRIDPQASVRPRLVLLGAAVPHGWLRVGSREGLALPQTSGALSVYNSRDAALKFFPLATGDKHTTVVGYRPISMACLNCVHLRQCDVTRNTGSSHKLHDYVNSSLGLVRAYALWELVD